MRRYFERKETYTVTLLRIQARHWKPHAEKFVQYAEAKLNLMQFLREKEKIELSADGVKDFVLRRHVLDTRFDNVLDFIDHVRKLTEDDVSVKKNQFPSKYPSKKQGVSDKGKHFDDRTCFTCKKPGHPC